MPDQETKQTGERKSSDTSMESMELDTGGNVSIEDNREKAALIKTETIKSLAAPELNDHFVNPNAGNGDCFYHALFEALYNVQSNDAQQQIIRNQMADYVLNLDDDAWVQILARTEKDYDKDSFAELISTKGEWTPDIGPEIAAMAFNVTIIIHQRGDFNNPVTIPAPNASSGTCHLLRKNRGRYEHYESITPESLSGSSHKNEQIEEKEDISHDDTTEMTSTRRFAPGLYYKPEESAGLPLSVVNYSTYQQHYYDINVAAELSIPGHKKFLLYGFKEPRKATLNRLRTESGTMRIIDEYNDAVGFTGNIGPKDFIERFFDIKNALEDPAQWKTYLRTETKEYPSEEVPGNEISDVQKWMRYLVKNKDLLCLKDINEQKIEDLFEENNTHSVFLKLEPGHILGALACKSIEEFDTFSLNVGDIHGVISEWIYQVFLRRICQLGLDFATDRENGLNGSVYFNLAAGRAIKETAEEPIPENVSIFGRLRKRFKGESDIVMLPDKKVRFTPRKPYVLKEMAEGKENDKNAFKHITESEYLHARDLKERRPSLADRIIFYNELSINIEDKLKEKFEKQTKKDRDLHEKTIQDQLREIILALEKKKKKKEQ